MNNVAWLEEIGKLEDFRYYLGADEDGDTKYDQKINSLSPLGLTRVLCGFELGDQNWADTIISFYTEASHNK